MNWVCPTEDAVQQLASFIDVHGGWLSSTDYHASRPFLNAFFVFAGCNYRGVQKIHLWQGSKNS